MSPEGLSIIGLEFSLVNDIFGTLKWTSCERHKFGSGDAGPRDFLARFDDQTFTSLTLLVPSGLRREHRGHQSPTGY